MRGRWELSDAQWELIERILRPQRRTDGRGRPWQDTRAVLNGILWVLGTGAQWRELPKKYPPYQTCHRRTPGLHSGKVVVGSTTALAASGTSGVGFVRKRARNTSARLYRQMHSDLHICGNSDDTINKSESGTGLSANSKTYRRCFMTKLFWLLIILSTGIAHAQLATDCTMYASPTGNDNNKGTTPATPKTFQGAASAASSPGSVICLEGGTYGIASSFVPPNPGGNGTGVAAGPPTGLPASAYIKYEGYGDSPAVLKWTGPETSGNYVIKMQGTCSNGSFCGFAYLIFQNFTIDCQNTSRMGIRGVHTHHMIVTGIRAVNCGTGIGFAQGDYYLIDHNIVFHSGYDPLLTQNLSGLGAGASCFYDNYAGLHQVISNNVVSGDYDHVTNNTGVVTDGNGLTQDQPCLQNSVTATTPSVLWLNNVSYMNGGRCFIGNWNTDAYLINNTCYKNMLETVPNYTSGGQGEITAHATDRYWFVNNIVYGWPGNNGSVNARGYGYKNGGATNLVVPDNSNLSFTLGVSGIPNAFVNADPLFTSPPKVSDTATGQYALAPDPVTITNAFTLQPGSPAIGRGVDPTGITSITSAVRTDLAKYVYTDINGNSRAAGHWDFGACQSSGSTSAAPSPPTALAATVQ